MRRLIIAMVLVASPAAASQCWQISDPDHRAFCRAVESKQKGQCTAISSYDLRQACYVRLGAPKSLCKTVSPGWPRAFCESA